MRKVAIILISMLILGTILGSFVLADENYNGEDDEQPRTGAPEETIEPDPETGDSGESPRTRWKDV